MWKFNSKLFVVLLLALNKTISGSANNALMSSKGLRIYGGHAIDIEQAPYQVSLRLRLMDIKEGTGHICGGSIIRFDVVLSAAHCKFPGTPLTLEAKDYLVVAGSTNRYEYDDSEQIRKVKKIVLHPDYNPKFNVAPHYDVMVLFLQKKFSESFWVRTIELNNQNWPVGTMCFISGWGTTETESMPNKLRGAKVPLISSRECVGNFRDTPIRIYPQSEICAAFKEGGTDSCQGDSGGPLACNGVLVGITSYGIDCAVAGRPGVYQNVKYFKDFIETTILNNGVDAICVNLFRLLVAILVHFII